MEVQTCAMGMVTWNTLQIFTTVGENIPLQSTDHGRMVNQSNYCKVGSTSTSHLEAQASFFRRHIKGKFDVYFGKKLISYF